MAPVDTVREDPVRKGLLFAGTENAVWVSFDDGDHWQSLQLNLPHTSMRDLWIHEDDLIVATHGRSFWILDDITPLRQASASLANSVACSTRHRLIACGATPTPTLRFRRMSRPRPILRTARSSTTICPRRPATVTIEILDARRPFGSPILEHRQTRSQAKRTCASN